MKKTYTTAKMDLIMLEMNGDICTDIIQSSGGYGDYDPWEGTPTL